MLRKFLSILVVFLLISCSEIAIGTVDNKSESSASKFEDSIHGTYASTYVPLESGNIIIKNSTLFDGNGNKFENYDLYFSDGEIKAVGANLEVEDALVIDGTGKFVTPGIIDNHSHMGVYPAPGVSTSSDGNEATNPVTAEVWAEHSVWTQDPQYKLALAGGITTFHVLPGSANLFGGRGVTLKNVSANTVPEMKFPGAPHSLKMACGENPKRVYRSRGPSTRMGNVAGYRKAWIGAEKFRDSLETDPDLRDIKNETLVGVLDGKILVHNHCYRADEMATMINISEEFGYEVSTFHHGVEAYKIADLLADEGICAALWADWWGFKHEAYDMSIANIAIVDQARGGKGCAIVHSDDASGIQRLNQEAAKALAAGRKAGFDISEGRAMTWITKNPAKSLGILDQTGTLEEGKDADIVIWSGNPFSIYSKAEQVYIDGALAFDKATNFMPHTDFDLGIKEWEVQ
ncbi:MAG: amidohydrolase [Gammaproteobacteria bacterium]|uniref:Amidohydrolase n=1 Tax=SAR86 cluster bacterium TaxID=2030880 RepID=A0A520MWM4_9GAMM|nr:MAG: amidohydrolase [SAR86 cluster bacterium]|tara:strand:+ start:1365 stop:2747 length:1383 start_codon:yes stop_codon:yes gene_type:complete